MSRSLYQTLRIMFVTYIVDPASGREAIYTTPEPTDVPGARRMFAVAMGHGMRRIVVINSGPC